MNSEQEREIDSFVNKNVLQNQDALVRQALEKGIIEWDEIENLYNPDNEEEEQEILAFYLVDKRFAEVLKEAGDPVIMNEYGNWWGRTTFGQAISMDGVIIGIYNKLHGTNYAY